MSCHRFTLGNTHGIVCTADIYRWKGFTFEWHHFCGPSPVHKRTLDPIKTIPSGFWEMVGEWQKLSKKEQAKFKI